MRLSVLPERPASSRHHGRTAAPRADPPPARTTRPRMPRGEGAGPDPRGRAGIGQRPPALRVTCARTARSPPPHPSPSHSATARARGSGPPLPPPRPFSPPRARHGARPASLRPSREPPPGAAGAASQEPPGAAMAENAAATGLESHRIKSFKNKGRDAEVRVGPAGPRPGPASAGGRQRRGRAGLGRARGGRRRRGERLRGFFSSPSCGRARPAGGGGGGGGRVGAAGPPAGPSAGLAGARAGPAGCGTFSSRGAPRSQPGGFPVLPPSPCPGLGWGLGQWCRPPLCRPPGRWRPFRRGSGLPCPRPAVPLPLTEACAGAGDRSHALVSLVTVCCAGPFCSLSYRVSTLFFNFYIFSNAGRHISNGLLGVCV